MCLNSPDDDDEAQLMRANLANLGGSVVDVVRGLGGVFSSLALLIILGAGLKVRGRNFPGGGPCKFFGRDWKVLPIAADIALSIFAKASYSLGWVLVATGRTGLVAVVLLSYGSIMSEKLEGTS